MLRGSCFFKFIGFLLDARVSKKLHSRIILSLSDTFEGTDLEGTKVASRLKGFRRKLPVEVPRKTSAAETLKPPASDPSVSKINWLHVDIFPVFLFYGIEEISAKSSKTVGDFPEAFFVYFSNSTASPVTGCRFSPFSAHSSSLATLDKSCLVWPRLIFSSPIHTNCLAITPLIIPISEGATNSQSMHSLNESYVKLPRAGIFIQ
jgi:hypothetical protein